MDSLPWTFYNSARRFLGTGAIVPANDTFMVNLYTHLSNAGDEEIPEVLGDLVAQVASGHGYLTSGIALSNVTWAATVDPTVIRFKSDPVQWNASGGDILDVLYAVISKYSPTASARKLLCYSKLHSSEFNITSGNGLKVQPHADGIFTLA